LVSEGKRLKRQERLTTEDTESTEERHKGKKGKEESRAEKRIIPLVTNMEFVFFISSV